MKRKFNAIKNTRKTTGYPSYPVDVAKQSVCIASDPAISWRLDKLKSTMPHAAYLFVRDQKKLYCHGCVRFLLGTLKQPTQRQ
ncbi:hypothetical protein PHMEG_00012304 [Phytophthora megakarya]|uniref:Uncharacterized protein n=1 Tax=Phytophthora megakarya TaxID=4795 RepID=A0A225WBP2_9STRA|nr:hypothetical protein PHMEG_00012304 [Phytophthora megakarya]